MSRIPPHPPLRLPPEKTIYVYIIDPCDCPCDDLVEVETPPRSVMALSYIAQALVVSIVGLNMGFRWCFRVLYMVGWGRSCRYRLLWIKTKNNSTVGKKIFTFGRNCSWGRRKAPLLRQLFPVVPAICHCTPKKTENEKWLLKTVCYDWEHAN